MDEATKSLRRVLGLPSALASSTTLALRRGLELRRRRYTNSYLSPRNLALIVGAISTVALALYVVLT